MAAPWNPPTKGEDFEIQIALESWANPGSFQANPTIAAGDFKVVKDGGTATNLTTLPFVEPASGVYLTIQLSATEMTADVVSIAGIDQTATKEWADVFISIPTTA